MKPDIAPTLFQRILNGIKQQSFIIFTVKAILITVLAIIVLYYFFAKLESVRQRLINDLKKFVNETKVIELIDRVLRNNITWTVNFTSTATGMVGSSLNDSANNN